MGIILDTGFYLGLIHPKDTNAPQSEKIFKDLNTGKYGLIYSTNLIFSEIGTLTFKRTNGNKDILQDLGELLWGEDKIAIELFTSGEHELQTWTLFQKLNSSIKSMKNFLSFVDTSLLVHAKELDINYIVSFDSQFDGHLMRIF